MSNKENKYIIRMTKRFKKHLSKKFRMQLICFRKAKNFPNASATTNLQES